VPGSETAPGPGRSADESTIGLNVDGTQKMLTSVSGLAAPPVVSAPAGTPVSTIVRATSLAVKAPDVRCPQLVKPFTVEQSVFAVQEIGRHAPVTVPVADEAHDVVQVAPTLHVQSAPDVTPPHLRAKVLRVLFLQNPQKMCVCSPAAGLSNAVLVIVPVSSVKPIGKAPRLAADRPGQSWLVGKSPSWALSPGVQLKPSLMPAAHLLVVGSQIGQGWMNVRHMPPGQSASVMHPKLAFVPPTHAPVSHAPEAQSASLQHGKSGASGVQVPPAQQSAPGVGPPEHVPAVQVPPVPHVVTLQVAPAFEPPTQVPRPLRQRPVSFTQLPPGHEPTATVPQPPPPVQFAPGVDPPEHRMGMRSACRKIAELSGML